MPEMKLNDLLKFSFKKTIRERSNKILLILFTLFTLLIMISTMFEKNFTNYIENTITNNIGFRSILVSLDFSAQDYGLSKLEKTEHIISIYNSKYSYASVESSFANEQLDGSLVLNYGDKEILPANIVGETISAKDTGVAVCPINFYPSSEAYNLFIDDKNIISGYDLLNKEFSVKYYSYIFDGQRFVKDKEYKKNFKIVGLYNSEDEAMPANTCYISGNDVKEIIEIERSADSETVYGFIAVVDNKKNVESVLEKLNNNGFKGSSVQMQLDTTIVNKIVLASRVIIGFLIICNVILTMFYIKKKVISEEKKQGIMMSIGYKKNIIRKIYFCEILFISLIAFIVGIVFFNIIFIILKKTLLRTLIYSGFDIHNFIVPYIISIAVVVLLPTLISIIFITNQYKKGAIILVRGEN